MQDHLPGDGDHTERRLALLHAELAARPPVIGVAGVSGAGKTTTIEALFHGELGICATSGLPVDLAAWEAPSEVRPGRRASSIMRLRVVDAPGLGEDDARDAEHLAMYNRELWACDVVLWVFPARSRAVVLDQRYLSRLTRFADRMVFGLNQVDLVEPGDWDDTQNVPSDRQATRIRDIVEHRKEMVTRVLGQPAGIQPYSATRQFNLHKLYAQMVQAVPEPRRELISVLYRGPH